MFTRRRGIAHCFKFIFDCSLTYFLQLKNNFSLYTAPPYSASFYKLVRLPGHLVGSQKWAFFSL